MMDTMILDKFASQPRATRWFWNTLTAIGWCFWLYLWSPLIMAIGSDLGIIHHTSTQESHFLQELVATYTEHFSMVVMLVSIFIGWAYFQQRRKIANTEEEKIALFKQPCFTKDFPYKHMPSIWKKTHRISVAHDDQSGQIVGVKITANKPHQTTQTFDRTLSAA